VKRRLGQALIVLGLLGILLGVLHVLNAADGAGPSAKRFEDRRSYNQVKRDLHAALFGGCLRAGIGFSLAVVGARLARRTPVDGQ
jgi:hypothetical protein